MYLKVQYNLNHVKLSNLKKINIYIVKFNKSIIYIVGVLCKYLPVIFSITWRDTNFVL